jgi:UDP-N-acetylmuramate dehydrogenase
MHLGQELKSISLAPMTTWRIGGPAERLYYPRNIEDLSLYLQQLPLEMPLTWLGLGSNLLVRDQGISGAVIATRPLNQLKLKKNLVYAEAGVTCAKLARFCRQHGYQGADFFAGIPGTVGGALAMNAGAFGGETWQVVKAVQTITRSGLCRWRCATEFDISYRAVTHRDFAHTLEGFVAAIFELPLALSSEPSKIRAWLQQRNQTQPIGTFNCGSVFHNPPGDYAARLIEHCGLKGFRLGGAMISPKHANFIINVNHATAQEMEQLITLIQNEIQAQYQIALTLEVKILGQSRDSNYGHQDSA